VVGLWLWRVRFLLGGVAQVPKSTKKGKFDGADDEDVPGSYLLIVGAAIVVIAVAGIGLLIIVIRH
jgi:hypothetical protein